MVTALMRRNCVNASATLAGPCPAVSDIFGFNSRLFHGNGKVLFYVNIHGIY